jgi:hypothetical protein
MDTQRISWFAIRISLAIVFLYSGTAKIFRRDMGQTRPTIFAEWSHSTPVRYTAVCGEVALSLWLLSGMKSNAAGILALAILSAFSGLIVLELGRDRPKPCGCMGAQSIATDPRVIRSSLQFDLTRNGVMMAGAAWLFLSAQKPKRRSGISTPMSSCQESPAQSCVPIIAQAGDGSWHSRYGLGELT